MLRAALLIKQKFGRGHWLNYSRFSAYESHLAASKTKAESEYRESESRTSLISNDLKHKSEEWIQNLLEICTQAPMSPLRPEDGLMPGNLQSHLEDCASKIGATHEKCISRQQQDMLIKDMQEALSRMEARLNEHEKKHSSFENQSGAQQRLVDASIRQVEAVQKEQSEVLSAINTQALEKDLAWEKSIEKVQSDIRASEYTAADHRAQTLRDNARLHKEMLRYQHENLDSSAVASRMLEDVQNKIQTITKHQESCLLTQKDLAKVNNLADIAMQEVRKCRTEIKDTRMSLKNIFDIGQTQNRALMTESSSFAGMSCSPKGTESVEVRPGLTITEDQHAREVNKLANENPGSNLQSLETIPNKIAFIERQLPSTGDPGLSEDAPVIDIAGAAQLKFEQLTHRMETVEQSIRLTNAQARRLEAAVQRNESEIDETKRNSFALSLIQCDKRLELRDKNFKDRIDSCSTAISHLAQRYDNLRTEDMASLIMGQFMQAYPNLDQIQRHLMTMKTNQALHAEGLKQHQQDIHSLLQKFEGFSKSHTPSCWNNKQSKESVSADSASSPITTARDNNTHRSFIASMARGDLRQELDGFRAMLPRIEFLERCLAKLSHLHKLPVSGQSSDPHSLSIVQ